MQVQADKEAYFHQILATGYSPVADDLNEDLEVVVVDDWNGYDSYAPLFFGISTNNGGMYLILEHAAADHHRIVELFKKLYSGPWVSSGFSKDGESALIHRHYYPEDV